MTTWLWGVYLFMLRNKVNGNKMPGIRKTFFIIFIISLAVSLFSSAAPAGEIEINPVSEGEDYCIMQLGEIRTFEASGFGWDKTRQEKIPGAGIEAIQWSFDSRFLELVEEKNNAVSLKAIKKRTSKLTATGKIDDKLITKTIFIVIK